MTDGSFSFNNHYTGAQIQILMKPSITPFMDLCYFVSWYGPALNYEQSVYIISHSKVLSAFSRQNIKNT